MTRIVAAALLALAGWLWLSQTLGAADGGFFRAEASLDAGDVWVVAGERYCPVPTGYQLVRQEIRPYYGICRVPLVEGIRPSVRSDYGRAMYVCWLFGYTLDECDESVRDGEF